MAENIIVSYSRTGEIQEIDTNSAVLGTIGIDYTDVPEDQRGGTAKQLLASAALYCFCGAFGKALQTRGAAYDKIVGKAILETGLDEKKTRKGNKNCYRGNCFHG